jgi:wyosine [tRNA(Phe)-imidazoG37] synthetase (radical SAM superfamily)
LAVRPGEVVGPETTDRRYTYGPVPSRRLGRSLGIDLVPFKTCTYDCVYCQLGRTTDRTVTRREYVPVAPVLAELEQTLAAGDTPDYISLAGSGEPTLNSGIGRLLAGIKGLTDIPVAVITNGSLLWMREVQNELSTAEVVLPSLDAGDERMFERVNRPHPAIPFDLVVDGLVAFTKRFQGAVWLEVLLLAGITDTLTEVEKIAAVAWRIAPTRIQLNTASRPPVEGFAHPVPEKQMSVLSGLFSGEVEIICDFSRGKSEPSISSEGRDADILALLGRRPCTADDIAAGLGLHVLDVLKRLDILLAGARVKLVVAEDKAFYARSGLEQH